MNSNQKKKDIGNNKVDVFHYRRPKKYKKNISNSINVIQAKIQKSVENEMNDSYVMKFSSYYLNVQVEKIIKEIRVIFDSLKPDNVDDEVVKGLTSVYMDFQDLFSNYDSTIKINRYILALTKMTNNMGNLDNALKILTKFQKSEEFCATSFKTILKTYGYCVFEHKIGDSYDPNTMEVIDDDVMYDDLEKCVVDKISLLGYKGKKGEFEKSKVYVRQK